MVRFAVVSAAGIGDALILEMASYHLRKMGHDVVSFTNHLSGFGEWLPNVHCQAQPGLGEEKEVFASFDAILVQHDNTPKARAILALRPGKKVYTFYTNYRLSKHGPLWPGMDFVFDEKQSMVENTKTALKELFSIGADLGENGLAPPKHLVYQKHPKRVAIHPTSTMPSKNWPKKKFLKVAHWLEKNGFEPVFVTSPAERAKWGGPELKSLADLASFLYESGSFLGNDSGPGHLASYLGIPYLIIGKQDRQMQLWRPGWHPGEIVTAPSWIPNCKGFRIRDEKWQWFVSARNIIKVLQKTALKKQFIH